MRKEKNILKIPKIMNQMIAKIKKNLFFNRFLNMNLALKIYLKMKFNLK